MTGSGDVGLSGVDLAVLGNSRIGGGRRQGSTKPYAADCV